MVSRALGLWQYLKRLSKDGRVAKQDWEIEGAKMGTWQIFSPSSLPRQVELAIFWSGGLTPDLRIRLEASAR